MMKVKTFDPAAHIHSLNDAAAYLEAAKEGGDKDHIATAVDDVIRAGEVGAYPNTSGIIPLDVRVLILPDAVEQKIGSILRPDSVVEREKYGQTKATLVACGRYAFKDWEEERRPAPGDRVIIGKYTGGSSTHTGKDGVEYKICNDEDVLALLEE